MIFDIIIVLAQAAEIGLLYSLWKRKQFSIVDTSRGSNKNTSSSLTGSRYLKIQIGDKIRCQKYHEKIKPFLFRS